MPASNALFTVGFTVAERVLYIPSMGAALIFAGLLARLLAHPKARWGVLALLSLALAWRTRERNEDWRTSERLFAAGVAALPRNAKLHYNLAHVTCKAEALAVPDGGGGGRGSSRRKRALKRRARCRKLYREAVRLAPDFQEAHGALGALLIDEDGEVRLREGLAHLELALSLNPHSKIAQKNLGDALARKQVDIPRARLHLENAVRLDPAWADAHNNLGL